jgi:hypothetical protein
MPVPEEEDSSALGVGRARGVCCSNESDAPLGVAGTADSSRLRLVLVAEAPPPPPPPTLSFALEAAIGVASSNEGAVLLMLCQSNAARDCLHRFVFALLCLFSLPFAEFG